MQPIDPVALGLCKQTELDSAVQKAAGKKAVDGAAMTDDERRKLLSTEQSLGMEAEPRIPTAIEGLETFSFAEEDDDGEEKKTEDFSDAESFFNLPDNAGDDEDDDEKS